MGYDTIYRPNADVPDSYMSSPGTILFRPKKGSGPSISATETSAAPGPWVPRPVCSPLRDARRLKAKPPMPPSPRILIVEDESLIAHNLARRLTRLGYTVVGRAATGTEAVRYAVTLHPHVVLMDIHLQGNMDGMEAARVIRTQMPIPIVFLSAYIDTAILAHLRETGAVAYLSKPVADQTLQQALQRVLSPAERAPR